MQNIILVPWLRVLCFFALAIALFSKTLWGMTNHEFVCWWSSYRNTPGIPIELKEMEDYFIDSNLLKDSTDYWNYLNSYNIQQIALYGYENFKQTVTRNYFTWVVSLDHPYASNLKQLVTEQSVIFPPEEINRIHPFFGHQESVQFNLITQYFLNYILKIGGAPLLEKLEEPLIGNPPYSTYKGKRVSQDIFNSLLEYLPISTHCQMGKISTVIEIGAGSGRTAFCFLTLLPNVKYVIVDFPPALYISQEEDYAFSTF